MYPSAYSSVYCEYCDNVWVYRPRCCTYNNGCGKLYHVCVHHYKNCHWCPDCTLVDKKQHEYVVRRSSMEDVWNGTYTIYQMDLKTKFKTACNFGDKGYSKNESQSVNP